ncbi:MAG: hypothetical protein NT038_00650 [Euryarchaeota archaeon]|nr:hypothetical protein [Euryarchaeota archaeon]
MTSVSNSNEALKYASYLVIAKYREKKGRSPSGLYFNKLMSLTHRILLEKGINIRLPHYWYRYGDQVHIHSMPHNLVWNHESPVKTTVDWRYEKPILIRDSTFDLIDQTVEQLTNQYAGKEKQLIEKVYNYAPFTFQREILDLREIIYGWKNAFNWDSKTYKRISKQIILKAFETFPEKDFPELKSQYVILKNLITVHLEKENWDFKLFESACITFWFSFCYYLRLKKGASENIPKETVSHWESILAFEHLRYRRIMADLIMQASEKNSKITENKVLVREYNWRLKDLDEAKHLIDEFVLT